MSEHWTYGGSIGFQRGEPVHFDRMARMFGAWSPRELTILKWIYLAPALLAALVVIPDLIEQDWWDAAKDAIRAGAGLLVACMVARLRAYEAATIAARRAAR